MSPVVRYAAALVLFALSTGLFVWFLKDTPSQPALPSTQTGEGNITGPPDVSRPASQVGKPADAREPDYSGPLLLEAATGTPVPGQRGEPIKLAGIDRLQPGESFAYYIPQEDRRYGARVAEVSVSASGNRIVAGFSRQEGVDYRFLFTVGRQQTFGTIYTPAGRYQLETRSGLGTIISGQTISEGLDFSQPDYVIPDPRPEPALETLRGN